MFLTAAAGSAPNALLHCLKHFKVLHERVVFLTVEFRDVPWVSSSERVVVEALEHACFRVLVRYGFMDRTDLVLALEACRAHGLEVELMETSFFVSRERVIPIAGTDGEGMPLWRDRLFAAMSRNGGSFADYFNIPANRVVEVGSRVEI